MKTIIILCFSFTIGYSTSLAQEITKQGKGYFNLTELGYFFSRNVINQTASGGVFNHENGAYALSLRNINGFFIGNNLSLGLGLGLDGYTFNSAGSRFDNTFLLFGDVRYYLHNEKNTFFGYGDLGNSIAIADNIAQGLFYNIGVGYKFMVATKTGMNASLGYNHQKINHDSSNLKETYSSLALKVGLMF